MSDKPKLLVVEDDTGLQRQLKWSYEDQEVILASDRKEAMEALRVHQPAVVTLDLGLPPDPDGVSEGFATLEAILAARPATKVIVASGHGARESARRAIAMGAAALYSYCIFPHSETHVTETMVGAAVLYSVGFTCMCFNVKEGDYPPPPNYVQGKVGLLAAVKTYAKECHSLPHYWFMWAQTFISSMSWGIGMYCLFMSQKIGLDLQQIGNIAGTTAIVTGVLILGSGWLAGRPFSPYSGSAGRLHH